MKYGRLQCKDIPPEIVVRAIEATPGPGTSRWRVWGDVLGQFDRLMPGVPVPLVYAKVHKMREVHACVHRRYNRPQCRGNVHLAVECTGC